MNTRLIKTRVCSNRILDVIFPIVLFVFSANGQGTIEFGFEEFPLGAAPAFVTQINPAAVPMISNNPNIPPFEGQKFLFTLGQISVKSPDQQPIQSFSLHLFIPQPPSPKAFSLLIGGAPQTVPTFGTWQTFQGSFQSPVQGINITLVDMVGEFWGSYAIDAVQFTTIPEPQTFWLLTMGAGAIALRQRLKHPNVHR